MTFAVNYETALPQYTCIHLFPESLPDGTNLKFCQELIPIIDRDCASQRKLERKLINETSFYLKDIENTARVAGLVSDMVECFPNVHALALVTQKPWKSQEIETIRQILSPVTRLVELELGREDLEVNTNDQHKIPEERKLGYAREWERVCPQLSCIDFPCRPSLTKVGSQWMMV
ncbi:hypothetical protein H0H87_005738 [Tephrocybe sp. NHM501043]|nr:hypothetical protein H0H87_005738 [Tephrocybe sp. NHM501043]